MIKDNAELIVWIHSQLEIARNRTYPYSDEYLLLKDNKDNKLVKVQVTNFSATDSKTHIYICLKPSDSFTYQKLDFLITRDSESQKLDFLITRDSESQKLDFLITRDSESQKIQPIPPVANIVSLCDSIIADIQLYGVDRCIQRLKDSGYKISE